MAASITPDADNVAALIDSFGAMISRLPGSSCSGSDGLVSLFGNTPLAFFNIQALDRPLPDPAGFSAAVARAAARARACPHGSFLAVCPSWAPAEAEALLAAQGYAPGLMVTGMAADTLLPPRRPLPALDYRLAPAPGVAAALGHINALAYGMDPAGGFDAVSEPGLWQGHSFGVVGYRDGTAVCSTGAFVIGDMIYIAFVATLPDYHGQGLAEAVMRHAILLAEQAAGPRRIWLHATEMGRPVYAAMGFETGAPLPLWAFTPG